MIKAIITDIEGTTSSLSFVKDVLFPYARLHLPDYVRRHAADPQVAALLTQARLAVGAELEVEELISQFIDWIDRDQKITPLKSLQGLIWEDGYQNGAFEGHIFEDAVRNLRDFAQRGLKLYIYSSGSVQAQKLLFSHTPFGNLTSLFSGYFDTHIGGKTESKSYLRIAEQIGFPAQEILFLSDIKQELDAARQAGLHTFWLVREQELDAHAEHTQIHDFDGVRLE